MRLNRPPGVASNPEPTGGHRAGAGVVRTLSVTALAAAACAMGALPASAATAHATKHSSRTILSVPKTGYTHTDIKLSATVKSSGKTPTGTVTFWFGTRKLCHGTLSKGKTSCDAKFFDPSTKTITGKYSGNSTHKASSGTATIKISNKPTAPPPPPPPPGPSATITTITNPPADVFATEPAGTPFTLVATVTAANGTVPTGTVAFVPLPPVVAEPNIECTAGTAAPLVDGTATCTVTPAVGTWGFILYEAIYTPSNTALYTGSNSTDVPGEHKLITPDITTTTLTFSPSPATEGDATTLTATVATESGEPLADAAGGPDLVTFSIGGVDIPGCVGVPVADPTDGADNIATCSYTPTAAGPVTILANYPGDLYAAGSSDTETLTVNS